MTPQTPAQLGVCSWSLLATSADDLAAKVKAVGVKKVQMALTAHREDAGLWDGVDEKLAEVGARVVSGMFGTIGEDYTSPQTIHKTGGFVPDQHWEGNLQIAKNAAKAGKKLGLATISTHAGFLPASKSDPNFKKLADRIATVAKVLGEVGIDLLFETGQETAETLLQFLDALDSRGAANTGVNFDPANMILYDMGDPVESLRKVMPRVQQLHIKDANHTTTPGQWGNEVVVGTGEVDWPAFMRVVAGADYTGDHIFEREAGDSRVADIKAGIANLTKVMARVK
jgi:L-ribulose-5-phosphate 3-epimerase